MRILLSIVLALMLGAHAQQTQPPTYLPAVYAKSRPDMPRFSVAIEGALPRAGYEQIKQLSVRLMRRWQPISWEAIEPVEGQYNWAALDGVKAELLTARADGVELLLSIQYTPAWARFTAESSCGAIRDDKHANFATFVAELARQLGTNTPYDARYWIIGNEVDIAYFEVARNSIYGCWGEPGAPYFGGERYGNMLKQVYPALKQVDPRAVLIMSGLIQRCDYYRYGEGGTDDCGADHLWRSNKFLEGVLRAGGGPFFDILPMHSYAIPDASYPSLMVSYYQQYRPANGGTGIPERVAQVRSVLSRFGFGDKPIMAGEINIKCLSGETEACTQINAAFIPRAYTEGFVHDLETTLYYHVINPNSNNGLLRPDLSLRPTYTAYLTMMNTIADARWTGPVTNQPGVTGGAWSASGGVGINVLWSTDGSVKSLTRPVSFLCALDYMGQPITLDAAQRIPLSWSPVYVITQRSNARARAVSQAARCDPARVTRTR
jgi:hypothetical protein